MTLPFSFSNNTSPTGGQLDTDLLAVAALGILDGTVTGTNALAFTQGANQPTVSVYTNNQKFAFTAVANSTSSVTLQVGSLAALPVYLPTGVQAGSGSISNGSYYVVTYLTALNTGLGGFVIISSIPSSVTAPVLVASAQGLLVKNNNSVPSTRIDITANRAVLQTTGGTPLYVATPSVTIDLTTTGANGMDVGARPTSGWVYNYLISTGSVTAGLATITAPTAGLPTFPGGYSYFMYVGAAYCDGSQNVMRTRQTGRKQQYVVTPATNTAALPNIANGATGTANIASVVFTAFSVAAVVPTAVAGRIMVVANTQYGGLTTSNVYVAPNTSYGAISSSNPSPIGLLASSYTANFIGFADFALESTNIYFAASANGGAVFCQGYEDYYVNA